AAKRLAITTLAKESGVLASDVPNSQDSRPTMFDPQWDEDFFSKLDQYEWEESERTELRKLEQGLIQARNNLGERNTKITEWKNRMEQLKEAVHDRTRKKRKAGGSAAAAPPPASGHDEAAIAAEAKRIPEAKLAAAELAQQQR
ncbi:unnamed protein product, partial [Prorocentrum cordatum]